MGINSHVAWDVRGKKKKSVRTAKFARESLKQFHEAVLAETNSSLLLVSDVNGLYFFEFVGLHTKLEDRSKSGG